jgi:hypothetical protein
VTVGGLEVPTYRPQPTSVGAEKPWAAALKSKQLLAAVCLQQLYFKTGRWQCDFLANQKTAMGRNRSLEIAPGSSPSRRRDRAIKGAVDAGTELFGWQVSRLVGATPRDPAVPLALGFEIQGHPSLNLSMRNSGSRVTPPIQVRASPGDQATGQPHWLWESVLGHHAINR